MASLLNIWTYLLNVLSTFTKCLKNNKLTEHLMLSHRLNCRWKLVDNFNKLNQGSPMYNPWAGCGPPRHLIWPEARNAKHEQMHYRILFFAICVIEI